MLVGARRCSAILRKRKRRQRCQRLDCSGRRGKKTPTLPFVLSEYGGEAKVARVQLQSAEAFSGVVKHPVPWSSRSEPKTPRGEHAMKVA